MKLIVVNDCPLTSSQPLLIGVYKHGYGRYPEIFFDPELESPSNGQKEKEQKQQQRRQNQQNQHRHGSGHKQKYSNDYFDDFVNNSSKNNNNNNRTIAVVIYYKLDYQWENRIYPIPIPISPMGSLKRLFIVKDSISNSGGDASNILRFYYDGQIWGSKWKTTQVKGSEYESELMNLQDDALLEDVVKANFINSHPYVIKNLRIEVNKVLALNSDIEIYALRKQTTIPNPQLEKSLQVLSKPDATNPFGRFNFYSNKEITQRKTLHPASKYQQLLWMLTNLSLKSESPVEEFKEYLIQFLDTPFRWSLYIGYNVRRQYLATTCGNIQQHIATTCGNNIQQHTTTYSNNIRWKHSKRNNTL
ncbi:hypothetical protein ACTA71_008535 [Dictyostelium dimigraforme]